MTVLGGARRTLGRAALLAPALLAPALLVVWAGLASAPAALLNPSANLPLPALPAACESAPRHAVCEKAAISDLNRGRAGVGLSPYRLPAAFATLAPVRQLFVLTNLDRVAYGLAPVSGLSPALSYEAELGIAHDNDPNPTAALAGVATFSWDSNWAGPFANALLAYYAWMYDDGWAGKATSNLDCTGPRAAGCWGHRENLLAPFPSGVVLSMGVAVGLDRSKNMGYTTVIAATRTSAWTSYSYTWTAALAGVGPHGAHGNQHH